MGIGSFFQRRQKQNSAEPVIVTPTQSLVHDQPSPAPPTPASPDSYPYSLPSPPKAWLFGGLGYGYGVGCSVGPVFGVGVGVSPTGVQFGAGATPVGIFCGVGLAAGLIAGQGSAYVPYGGSSPFFLAPRFVMLERYAELYRTRAARRRERSRARRDRAMDTMWPKPIRNLFHDLFLDGLAPSSTQQSLKSAEEAKMSERFNVSHSRNQRLHCRKVVPS